MASATGMSPEASSTITRPRHGLVQGRGDECGDVVAVHVALFDGGACRDPAVPGVQECFGTIDRAHRGREARQGITGRGWHPAGSVRQTIFRPFALTSRLARGQVLRVEISSPTYRTARFGEVAVVDAVATHDPDTGDTVVFMVNRHRAEPVTVKIPLAAFGDVEVAEAWTLSDPDTSATDQNRIVPRTQTTDILDGTLSVELSPVSWNAVRLIKRHQGETARRPTRETTGTGVAMSQPADVRHFPGP